MSRILLSLLFALAAMHAGAGIHPAQSAQPVGIGEERTKPAAALAPLPSTPDLSGEWEILEVEDDKRYKATLDKAGNGPYSQQGGRFTTTKYADRLWQGTWQQSGNDREGGFEILLAEDGMQAKGRWWYSRVGSQKNIPPREHGGTYQWKRLTPAPTSR